MEPGVKIDQNDSCCDSSETTNLEVRTTHHATVMPTTTLHVADARFDKNVRLVVLYLQIMIGSLGGILVFAWLWKNRRRKSRVNVIIGNLAMADILVISFTCVMQVRDKLEARVRCAFRRSFGVTLRVVCKMLPPAVEQHI
jgi:hypothetical protein